MDRFGSSRLRIVWTCLSLLMVGLVLTGIQGFSSDGSGIMVFGGRIPLGMEDVKAYVVEDLGRLIYTLVPAVILLGGVLPLGEWLAAGARPERTKALFLGTAMAFLHGIFLSQVSILPLLAASHRLLGSALARPMLTADLNAVVLGLQLLLWASLLGQVLRSNRGLAILLAYAFHEAGRIMAWGGEFLGDLDVPAPLVKSMAFLGGVLPTGQLPSESLAWRALPLSLLVPLGLSALMILLPAKAAKAAKRSKG
jgi:fumarate reductase subunit D